MRGAICMTMMKKTDNYSSDIVSEYPATTTTDLLGERALRMIRHEVEGIGIRWTAQLQTMVRGWLRQVSPDLILDYAIMATASAPAPSVRYLAAIMRRCLAAGYRSAADAWQRDDQDRQAYLSAKAARRGAGAYQQRDYTGQPEINDLMDWAREAK